MAAEGAARFGQVARQRTAPPAPVPAPAGSTRKYTVLLDAVIAADFDEDLLRLRRGTGKRIDKSQVVRELVSLLHEDPGLMAEVTHRLTA